MDNEIENDHGMYYDESIPGYFGDGHDRDDSACSGVKVGQEYWTLVRTELESGWYSIVHVRVDTALKLSDRVLWKCSLIETSEPHILPGDTHSREIADSLKAMHCGKVWPRSVDAGLLFNTVEGAVSYIIRRYSHYITTLETQLKNGTFANMADDGCVLVCPVYLDRPESVLGPTGDSE